MPCASWPRCQSRLTTPGLAHQPGRSACACLHRRHKLGLIVVDYLTLIRGDGDKTTDRVGDVAQRLKVLAKELDCVVIALSQMSRECEKRPDKRGQLSDLRDSGEIEQAADVVIFLYREELTSQTRRTRASSK